MSPCRHVSVTSEILQATLPMASIVAAVNALSELLMYVCIHTDNTHKGMKLKHVALFCIECTFFGGGGGGGGEGALTCAYTIYTHAHLLVTASSHIMPPPPPTPKAFKGQFTTSLLNTALTMYCRSLWSKCAHMNDNSL